ncbi:hypothetical protein MPSEU_000661400 [Mayamaea pseudoterrestris]|nr:hypothetical protein MPSEU_000661400 [Mayamaea pseudoterrestris]
MFRMLKTAILVAAIAALSSFDVVDASIRPIDTSRTVFRAKHQADATKAKLRSTERPAVSQQSRQPAAALSVRGGITNSFANAIGGSVALAVIQQAVKQGLRSANIDFPDQLAACVVLFVSLLLIETVSPALANNIFNALSPGSALLAKWLPVFFVPGLVLLPLSKSIGGASEIIKVLMVVAAGFVFTILSTTYSVVAVRKSQRTFIASGSVPRPTTGAGVLAKPFSEQDLDVTSKATLLFGVASLFANRVHSDLETPVRTLFMLFGTFASYIWGARLPSDFTRVVHPLVTSSVIVMGLSGLLAALTGSTFRSVLSTYKTGTLDANLAGAGDILLYLLGPSVVSFAVSMFSRRSLLKANFLVVLVSMLVSSGASLYATAFFVRLLDLGGPGGALVRLSVLSRNVTTALAMAVTSILGGDISIACTVVVLTGILGATVGKSFLTHMGITDPASRGLGIGASSQGLGVASLSDEPEAFPFAAVSMVLTAVAATTLVSIPSVRESLINIACG